MKEYPMTLDEYKTVFYKYFLVDRKCLDDRPLDKVAKHLFSDYVQRLMKEWYEYDCRGYDDCIKNNKANPYLTEANIFGRTDCIDLLYDE